MNPFPSLRVLTRILLAVTLTALADCSSDDPEPTPDPTPTDPISVEFATPSTSINSISVVMTVSNVSEYAYCVIEQGTPLPDAETILSENPTYEPESTEVEITVDGLEPETDYTLVVAAHSTDGEQTQRFTVDATTTYYENILTITDIDQTTMSFHVECGPNQYWKYTIYS